MLIKKTEYRGTVHGKVRIYQRREYDEWYSAWRASRLLIGHGWNFEGISMSDSYLEEVGYSIVTAVIEIWRPAVSSRVKRPRDSQKSKLYNWENKIGIFKTKKISIDDAISTMQMLWESFGFSCNQPTIKCGRGGFTSYSRGSFLIVLQPRHHSLGVLAHELAHSIISICNIRDRKMKFASHGAEFVRVYIQILTFICSDYSSRSLVMDARKSRVKVAPKIFFNKILDVNSEIRKKNI